MKLLIIVGAAALAAVVGLYLVNRAETDATERNRFRPADDPLPRPKTD